MAFFNLRTIVFNGINNKYISQYTYVLSYYFCRKCIEVTLLFLSLRNEVGKLKELNHFRIDPILKEKN